MARHRRRIRPPEGVFAARVESLAHDGRGVAHLDGKAVFVHGALPGEEVGFRYTACHSRYDEGRAEEIVRPSPQRVAPRCAHFGVCGGCSLQHLDPTIQITRKQDWLLDNLARIGRVEPQEVLEPLTGPYWEYRYKARLGVKNVFKKNRVLVGFREQAGSFLADLRRCEVLHPQVGGRLEALAELVQDLSIRERLPQIEVAAGDEAVALSFRVLERPNPADEARLVAFGRQHDLQIWLQTGGPRTCYPLWPENARLSYRLPEFELTLEFKPWHFTQVNPAINRQMVARAVALLEVAAGDHVLDLFCGLGNFTLPLARRAARVTGVEGDPGLVEWAGRNAVLNGIANARFFGADLAVDPTGQPWLQERCDKVLLDPPRCGAPALMAPLAALRPRRLLYVSCHPATLARDAAALVHDHGYRLLRAGVMDMFPHTAHVESMALFEPS